MNACPHEMAVLIVAGSMLFGIGSAAQALDCPNIDLLAEKHTFRILASGVGDSGRTQALTEFHLEGHESIVTALHGVIGTSRIDACNADLMKPFDRVLNYSLLIAKT